MKSKVAQSYKSCINDYSQIGEIASVFSSILCVIAFCVLYRQKRYRSFPHNLGPFICLSFSIFNAARAGGFAWGAQTLKSQPTLCWFTGFFAKFGIITARTIWVASIIVLYLTIVKRTPLAKIAKHKIASYVTISAVIIILSMVPLSWTSVTYSPARGRCSIKLSPVENFALHHVHNAVAALMFLIIGPPVVKTLLSKQNKAMLNTERANLLRDEAFRQVALGVVVFLMASIASVISIQDFLYSKVRGRPEEESHYLRHSTYTICAMGSIIFGFGGIAISVIYLVNRENYATLKKWFSNNMKLSNDDGTTIATEIQQQQPYAEVVSPKSHSKADKVLPSPRTLLHSKTIHRDEESETVPGRV